MSFRGPPLARAIIPPIVDEPVVLMRAERIVAGHPPTGPLRLGAEEDAVGGARLPHDRDAMRPRR